VTIHPGAGGTGITDWAEMLLRMYLRWAERQGFQTVLYDYQPGKKPGSSPPTFAVMVNTRLDAHQRDWRAPPSTHFAFDSSQAPAHVLRQRLRFAGN